MIDLLDYDQQGLRTLMKELLGKAFRGDQIRNRIYRQGCLSIGEITDLSLEDRKKLSKTCRIGTLTETAVQTSKEKTTTKWAFETKDHETIETVLIREQNRRTACISTQIGCDLGCRFCASAKGGNRRNLTESEIVEQAIRVRNADDNLTNVVVMGIGEPLLNYDNVVNALRTIHAPWGLNVGARRTTISTCGIVPGILKLAREKMQWRLAVSLHAPFDSARIKIMPITRKYPIREVIAAARVYARTTKSHITYEYILIKDFNMRPRDADRLAALLKNQPAKLNLIPMNPVTDSEFKSPTYEQCLEFQSRMKQLGITAMMRKERGRDIDAACGQLRRKVSGPL